MKLLYAKYRTICPTEEATSAREIPQYDDPMFFAWKAMPVAIQRARSVVVPIFWFQIRNKVVKSLLADSSSTMQ